MRAAGLALALAALSGCGKSENEDVHLVAVGARDATPTTLGPCRTAEARPESPVHFSPRGDTYEAVAPGRVRVPCQNGIVVLDVRRPSRVAIDTSQVVKRGDLLVMRVQAFAEGGERLSIGEAPVAWSFTGALSSRPPPACSEGAKVCPPQNGGFARAYDEGEGQVLATFAGLSSRISVSVVR
jgi:hypothetical protein